MTKDELFVKLKLKTNNPPHSLDNNKHNLKYRGHDRSTQKESDLITKKRGTRLTNCCLMCFCPQEPKAEATDAN